MWETGTGLAGHLVLAVSSKIKVMCHSCIFIVFLIQCIPSHLQHNIIECMRGVYVLAKHSSYSCSISCKILHHFLQDMCKILQDSARIVQEKGHIACTCHARFLHNLARILHDLASSFFAGNNLVTTL